MATVIVIFFILNRSIYLVLVVPGLRCYAGSSLLVVSGGYSLAAVHQFLPGVAPLVAEHGL